MSAPIESQILRPADVFGPFRHIVRFSPFNCGPGPLKFFFFFTSLSIFLSMIFRCFWLLYLTETISLTFGWAERNTYAFITFESFSCVICLFQMTRLGSIPRFEENIGRLQNLRISRLHEKHDNYGALRRKLVFYIVGILISFAFTTANLCSHGVYLMGSTSYSNWYYIFDAIVSMLCAYTNFVFLPIHTLMHSAIRREIDCMNDELTQVSEKNGLSNISTLQKFGFRQIKLMDVANTLATRLQPFMSNAPLLALTALVNSTYITFSLRPEIEFFYYISLVFLFINITIITSLLMYPPASIQDSMLKTSHILMNDPNIQDSSCVEIHNTYRMMVERSVNNRQPNHVTIFSLNTNNVKRAFFLVGIIAILMFVLHAFGGSQKL